MAKNEGANVSRCYVPNLRWFWIVKLSFLTLLPATKSQVVFSRRVLQDFAIYNQAHFWGMI